MSLRVMVIGAGLGGLTLANGLSRAGVEVVVHERDPEPEARAQGARVHIDDRGVQALRACLPSEQFEFFRATVGRPSKSLCEVGEVDGRWAILGRYQFFGAEGVPDSVRPGWPVSRQLLRRTLLSGIGGHVRFGKELLRYELPPAGGVRAYFADGSTDSGNVLVGADGIGSPVRGQYLPYARVVDTGMRWLGGKTPMTTDVLATGLPDLIEGSFTRIELGEVGMLLATVGFQEPPVAAAARLLPDFEPADTEDYVMWALLPGQERLGRSDADLGMATGAELWVLAKSLTRAAHPDLRLIVDQAWPEQTYWLQVGTGVPVAPWPPTAVTLLGDAIHAMPPNRGSGANTALQDAGRLAANLIAVNRGQLELLPAIADYEDQMRRDGFEAVIASVSGLNRFTFRN